MPRSRRSSSPGRSPTVAPVQAQAASTLWGMPWMRVFLALLVSVVLQFVVYVYTNTFTSVIRNDLIEIFNSDHPQYNKMLAMAANVQANQVFIGISSLVIQIVCFVPLIVVFFLQSTVAWLLGLLWWLVFNRYTIGCAFGAAILAYLF